MPTPEITLFPKTAQYPGDIKGFIRDGEVFHIGDRVMLTHRPSGSRLFGTLGKVYGVGRIRGFKVEGVPFGRDYACYPMGQPADDNYGLSLVERGDEALALAKAHFIQRDGTPEAWDAYTDLAREGYLTALGVAGKL